MANITDIDNNKTLYDQDFYLWIQTTIQQLKDYFQKNQKPHQNQKLNHPHN